MGLHCILYHLRRNPIFKGLWIITGWYGRCMNEAFRDRHLHKVLLCLCQVVPHKGHWYNLLQRDLDDQAELDSQGSSQIMSMVVILQLRMYLLMTLGKNF